MSVLLEAAETRNEAQPIEARTQRRLRAVRRRPRVLHMLASFEIGGTERQAVELLRRLDHERFDVRLAVIRKTGPLYGEIADLFPEVTEYPLTSFYNRNAARQLARLRRQLVEDRIDILHAHDFYAGFIGSAAARLAGARIIACQRHLKLSDRRAHHLGTRAIHYLAHRLLVNSEAIRDSVVQLDRRLAAKIVVVRNGLNIPGEGESLIALRHRMRSTLIDELGIERSSRIAGMVARLQPVKGHAFFIEAAARLARRFDDLHFVLIGDGPLRSEILEQVERAGIAPRLHLLGDRAGTAQLVAGFDVAVLASLHEGLPNTVLEAMAAGTPVVATAVGGVNELIEAGHTGFPARPGDADSLAEQLAAALEDSDRAACFAEAARHRVQTLYGMDRMVAAVEELYEEVLGVGS